MGSTGALHVAPEPGDFVSLVERMGWLGIIRSGFVAAALSVGLLVPGVDGAPQPELIVSSAAYLLILLAPLVIGQQPRSSAQRIVAGTLLVDGVYLASVTYATGGTQSPLLFLIVVHVVTVTLLASYRTGLKVT